MYPPYSKNKKEAILFKRLQFSAAFHLPLVTTSHNSFKKIYKKFRMIMYKTYSNFVLIDDNVIVHGFTRLKCT